jgi:hypothetical protein
MGTRETTVRAAAWAVVSAGAWTILTLLPVEARAQAPRSSRPVGGYVMVSAGLARPDASTMEVLAKQNYDGVRDEFLTEYRRRNRLLIDVAGGVVIASRLTLGIAIVQQSSREPAAMTLTFDQTFAPFDGPLTTTEETDPLERLETGLHIQVGYLAERGGLRAMVFAGPSRINLTAQLVSDYTGGLRF